MNIYNKDNKISAAERLIANAGSAESQTEGDAKTVKAQNIKKSGKVFQRFKIKDIIFLAIMAACTLVTGAVMPIVAQIPVFGIVQICLGLQFSIFPVIALMKVRKVGSIVFFALCCGVIMIFMNPIMFFSIIISAFIAEGLPLLIFRGYKSDWACVTAGTVFLPVTLPFLYLYYKFLYTFTGEEGKAVTAFLGAQPAAAIGMSIAVLAVCFIGSLVGMKIARELKKAGKLKS